MINEIVPEPSNDGCTCPDASKEVYDYDCDLHGVG